MAELRFVANQPHYLPTLWLMEGVYLHWISPDEQVYFQIGCRIGDDNSPVAFMESANPRLLLTSRGSNHREKDFFAAYRAAVMLNLVRTSPNWVLGTDLVESAFAAGMRRSDRPKTPGYITRQSEMIIRAIGKWNYNEIMGMVIPDVEDVVSFLMRETPITLSHQAFWRELNQNFLTREQYRVCRYALGKIERPNTNGPRNLTLFGSDEVDALHILRAKNT
ncbi:MAG: hypothetical protein WC451_01870 [Patescibacteria group bacterium]